MKLELKHYSVYLPYEVNIDPIYKSTSQGGYYQRVLDTYILDNYELDEIKLILRPLSDLATFIKHDGIEFYPLEWIAQELDYDLYSLEYYREHTLRIPYEILNKLLEWHFDIFGLIENILAIDINTLNKIE